MRRASMGVVLSALSVFAAPLSAQGRAEFGPGRGARAAGAEFFLARTGELRLTDGQVVRLAAIARRAADRRRAMRASMDSLSVRRPAVRGDSIDRAARMREAEQMRARFQREHEQGRTELRDALAVLTPDQQATAWELVARRGPGARGASGARSRDRRRGDRPRGADRPRRPPPGQRPPQ
jgi:Spy/CpxP family protein refolding chaperone